MITELQSQDGQKIYKRNEKLLCSAQNPKAEAQKWIQSLQISPASTNFVVIGIGSGFHIQELKTKFPHANIKAWDIDLELVNKVNSRLAGIAEVSLFESEEQLFSHSDFYDLLQRPVQILDFRPSWQGLEKKYSELSDLMKLRKKSSFEKACSVSKLIFSQQISEKLPPNLVRNIKTVGLGLNGFALPREMKLWSLLSELVN